MVNTILDKLPPGLGCVKGVEHEIHVRNARPIKQRPYPVSERDRRRCIVRCARCLTKAS